MKEFAWGDVRALSVQSPWWWYILHDFKGIENRSRRFNFRGTILIHASKFGRRPDIILHDLETANSMHLQHLRRQCFPARPVRPPMPTLEQLHASSGCIVGQVEIIGCTTKSSSPWFVGPYGIMLQDPVIFKNPIPCKGALGLWHVPGSVLDRLAEMR